MKPKKRKCIKNSHDTVRLKLGGKTKLNDIMEMGDRSLVSQFLGKRMSNEELKD
jgi:hypothetical protein